MKSIIMLPLALLAGTAVAASEECGADYIVEACLSSEKAKLAACKHDDYVCKCENWKNIVTCYNNCPNDERKHTDQGQVDIFCGYVTQFATTTTTARPTATQTDAAQQTTDAAEATGDEASSTETETAASPASTNSGADLVLNAGGMLAAVAGVVAAVL
ncbi:hypothetical protein VTJ04DRAFT_9791 [Mycothermus thermophilus]|uniref:uncharacterized protein n=1 Tax=Humicola insolens TaxID=85995 RepID=UPI0037433BDE